MTPPTVLAAGNRRSYPSTFYLRCEFLTRWVVRRERGQDLDSAWLALLYLVLGDHLGEQAQVVNMLKIDSNIN